MESMEYISKKINEFAQTSPEKIKNVEVKPGIIELPLASLSWHYVRSKFGTQAEYSWVFLLNVRLVHIESHTALLVLSLKQKDCKV